MTRRAMTLPYPPPWQNISTLAEHICVGESTIENWVKVGLFPPPKRVGGKRLWSWKEVERYLAGPEPIDVLLDGQSITNATKAASGRHG